MHTYADVSIACGPRFHEKYRETLINPTVIVEILSSSTEAYDRGAKFAHYRTIPGFVEYVLVSQHVPLIEVWRKNQNDAWEVSSVAGKGERAVLEALGIELDVDEIYRSPL